MGVVINRLSDITISEVLHQFDDNYPIKPATNDEDFALAGGPVQQEHGFVLHRPSGEWEYSLKISDQLTLTTSQDIIRAIAKNQGPEDFIFTLGYAGWGAGQLEEEIAANSWLTIPANPDIVFQYPISARRASAAAVIGLNLETLSAISGHA
jgi:putative transcriptional regulator